MVRRDLTEGHHSIEVREVAMCVSEGKVFPAELTVNTIALREEIILATARKPKYLDQSE